MATAEWLATVEEVKWLTPTVFQIGFNIPSFQFEAGQWVSIVVPKQSDKSQDKDLRRAYSIASPPEQTPRIELCIKKLEKGPGTTYLSSRKQGDVVKLFAPYGAFTLKSKMGRNLCFVATGTGISPFRSILKSKKMSAVDPRQITMVLGVRYEDEVLYRDEFNQIKNLKWIEAISQPRQNIKNEFKGRVTDWFKQQGEQVVDWSNTDFYLCGNGKMIDEIKKWLLEEKAVPKQAVFQEIYYKL